VRAEPDPQPAALNSIIGYVRMGAGWRDYLIRALGHCGTIRSARTFNALVGDGEAARSGGTGFSPALEDRVTLTGCGLKAVARYLPPGHLRAPEPSNPYNDSTVIGTEYMALASPSWHSIC
jgi:hypothetical protein